MKIIKITDGFITNSSTDSTTVLLALKKGKNLLNFFQTIGFPGKYPLDFFNYETDQLKVYEFLKEHDTNLVYLEKDYDLNFTIIDHHGPENKIGNDELYRVNLVFEMVEEIKKKGRGDVIVLSYGDALHDGFYLDRQDIYKKEEVREIFRGSNIELMNSLIQNKIVKHLSFTDKEKALIIEDLVEPLEEIVDKPSYEWDEYQFKLLYYDLFGDEYIKALLRIVGPDFTGFEKRLGWIWNLHPLSLRILKAKLNGTLLSLTFEDGLEYCKAVSIVASYFGNKELFEFLSGADSFDMLKVKGPFSENMVLLTIASAIVTELESNNKEMRMKAENFHQKLMGVLRFFFFEEGRLGNIQVIRFIINPYRKKKKLSMVTPTLVSIPVEILAEIIDDLPMGEFKDLLLKALDTRLQRL